MAGTSNELAISIRSGATMRRICGLTSSVPITGLEKAHSLPIGLRHCLASIVRLPRATETLTSEPIVLGRISGVFGVRGWVRIYSYTDPREAVLNYEGWLLGRERSWQSAEVAEGQRHGKTVVARIAGVDDRDQAAELVGKEIAVPRDALPDTEEGHYYWQDLEGLKVVRSDGSELGSVAYLLETGAHDVMVVKGDIERLVPFVRNETVIDVDLARGVIVVDWEWD